MTLSRLKKYSFTIFLSQRMNVINIEQTICVCIGRVVAECKKFFIWLK